MSAPADVPLYATDEQIARAVFGPGKSAVSDWKTLAAAARGMPEKDPVTNRRYWPAVRAFLDRRAGLHHHAIPATIDGQENFDADAPRPRARSQAVR